MSDQTSFHVRVHNLDYTASVAMRYHSYRRAFLDTLSKSQPVGSLLLGSSAFAAATSQLSLSPAVIPLLTLAVATLSAISLSFGFAEKARLHEGLFRRWADLRAKLADLERNDVVALQSIEVERAKIAGDTPHQIRALTVLCQNEENEFRQEGTYHIGAAQRLFAQLFTFPFNKFPPEVQAR